MAPAKSEGVHLSLETIELFDDRILIEIEEGPQMSRGGIYMPDTTRAKDAQSSIVGLVLAIGPGKKKKDTEELIPMRVKIGDRVLFNKYAGTHSDLRGKTVRIVHQEELLGKVTSAA